MPLTIHKDARPSVPVSGGRKRAVSSGDKQPVSLWVVVVAGLILVVFIAFLFHRFVMPLPGLGPQNTTTKVQPLSGMPDAYPYNTREWQELYNKGWVVWPDNKTIKQKEMEAKSGVSTGPTPGGLVAPAPGMPPVPLSPVTPPRPGQ